QSSPLFSPHQQRLPSSPHKLQRTSSPLLPSQRTSSILSSILESAFSLSLNHFEV
ncbi:hypothetical protein GIB67_024929, partial [Kingdonia uniflora]